MKLKLLRYSIIILLFFYNLFKLFSTEPSIELLSHNSGGKFYSGDKIFIKWQSNSFNENLDILLWDGRTKTYYPIADNIKASSKQASLVIPDNIEGDRFRIKIVSKSNNFYDMSDCFFSIKKNLIIHRLCN
jgi:hypothetical protein